MLRKFALPVAALSLLVLLASVPVFAQDGYETGELISLEAQESGLVHVDPSRRGFSCAFLTGDPATTCTADENGFFTTQSGIRFPVGETDDDAYAGFIQYGGIPGSEGPTPPSS